MLSLHYGWAVLSKSPSHSLTFRISIILKVLLQLLFDNPWEVLSSAKDCLQGAYRDFYPHTLTLQLFHCLSSCLSCCEILSLPSSLVECPVLSGFQFTEMGSEISSYEECCNFMGIPHEFPFSQGSRFCVTSCPMLGNNYPMPNIF